MGVVFCGVLAFLPPWRVQPFTAGGDNVGILGLSVQDLSTPSNLKNGTGLA